MRKIAILLFCTLLFSASLKAYDDAFEAVKADAYIIDGQANEDFWDSAAWYDLSYVWLPYGTTVDSADFSGRFKLAWTENVLLILGELEDDLLSDENADPLTNYWQDDCFEVFLDEDHSGGGHNGGAVAFNAFAYHISTLYDVVDGGASGNALFNDHVEAMIDSSGNIYTWEVAIKIYDDTYDEAGSNTPVILTENKEMGFSLAYCDNDGTGVRENFIGAVNVSETDQNNSYLNADVFGTLTLMGEEAQPLPQPQPQPQPSSVDNKEVTDGIAIFPSHVQDYLYVNFPESIAENINIQVYNIEGKLMLSEDIQAEKGTKIPLNLNYLHQGSYIIRINGDGFSYSELFYKD